MVRLYGNPLDIMAITALFIVQSAYGELRIIGSFFILHICRQNDRIILRIEGLEVKLLAAGCSTVTRPFYLGLLPLDPICDQRICQL